MREEAIPGRLFAAAARRPAFRRRRLSFLAGSMLLQAALVAFLVLARPPPRGPEGAAPVVAVRVLQPQIRAPAPPSPVRPLSRRPVPGPPPAARVVQPREAPAELPPPDPRPEPVPGAPPAEASGAGGGSGGLPEGVVGGAPTGTGSPGVPQGPPAPIPARTHDLTSVRAGIARVLVYPPQARRNGIEGKVVVEFVLLADGGIRDLVLLAGSGFPVLDAAALAAVRGAAPYPPPGVDVRIVVPVAFRAE